MQLYPRQASQTKGRGDAAWVLNALQTGVWGMAGLLQWQQRLLVAQPDVWMLPVAGKERKGRGSNPHARFPMFFLSEEARCCSRVRKFNMGRGAKGVLILLMSPQIHQIHHGQPRPVSFISASGDEELVSSLWCSGRASVHCTPASPFSLQAYQVS